MCSGKDCSKYVIFTVNILFFVVGAVVAGISIAGMVQLKKQGNAAEEIMTFLIIGCVVGSIVLLSSCFGCWGAASESKCILLLYVISLVVMIGLGGFAVYKGLTVNETKLKTGLHSKLNTTFSDQTSFHKIEKVAKCCGVDGPSDYKKIGDPLPKECCSVEVNECTTAKNDTCTCPPTKISNIGCTEKIASGLLSIAKPATYAMVGLCVVEVLMLIGAAVMVTYEKAGNTMVFSNRA